MARFELRDLGEFPGLVRGGEHAVAGKVYDIDAATLVALDQLEGAPALYRRTGAVYPSREPRKATVLVGSVGSTGIGHRDR